MLSQYIEERYAVDLIGDCAEGVGYLLKDRVGDLDAFADAVRRVGEGGSVLDPEVVGQMLGRRRRIDPLDELSPREREVLELMAQGRSNSGIAEQLVITESAVEKHVTSIFDTLGIDRSGEAHRRILAVLTFLRCAMTDTAASPARLEALVREQAALRRVATLVAPRRRAGAHLRERLRGGRAACSA